MAINIIDRRKNPKGKSSENRQRFLKRVEDQIKKALPDILDKNKIKDLSSTDKVKVPVKSINEPRFIYDKNTGDKKYVNPGNKEYTEGDRIRKPQGGGSGPGKGKGGSNKETIMEDEFTITINRDEFLDYFFSDLELPDMVKKHLSKMVDWKQKRAGYSSYGNPSRLNVVRSYKNSMARRMATAMFFDKKIKEIEEKLKNKNLSKIGRAHV